MADFFLQVTLSILLPTGRAIYRRFPRALKEYVEPDSDLGVLLSFGLGVAALTLLIWLTYAICVKLS
jgi:hypothetical protein